MSTSPPSERKRRSAELALPAVMVGIVIAMVLPMPTALLDLLLASNLSLALVILLTATVTERTLEFSVFPSLLLVTTLARLALNVSSTRLILLNGNAGHVISAFGHFVVGGNLVVGLVVFAILVVIQFAVITNGAGRVAEVSARFTLDAMPGKQMAIDADLNAGLCTEEEARKRRIEVGREADFFGAMDGASKFVKGDAIAAVVIVMVNLIGGIVVGVVLHHLSLTAALQRYALLSVGDGLVSQIPALLISVASGIVVTRADSDLGGGLGGDLFAQLAGSRQTLRTAAGAVGVIGMLPGLPKLPFIAIAIGLVVLSTRTGRMAAAAAEPEVAPVNPDSRESLIAELHVEPLELGLAPDLLDLLQPTPGGSLVERVRALRHRIAGELGLVLPAVHTRDDSSLPPSTYRVRLHGVEVGRGTAPPGHVLVLGDAARGLPGRPTVDPTFGLPAMWVAPELGDLLAADGVTVVDRASVLVTHLSELVRRHAPDLLSRQDVAALVDAIRRENPALGAEVGDNGVSLTEVHRVLRDLLSERVPVRDLRRILEAITARARDTKSHEALVEAARVALGPAITASAAGPDGRLATLTLEPVLEQALLESVRTSDSDSFLAVEPAVLEGILEGAGTALTAAESAGHRAVVVCAAALRPALRRLVAPGRGDLKVMSYAELGGPVNVVNVGVIRRAPIPTAA
ncbi:MAG TPA: flagellar biosynthesis protein FlhA [Mycobacteriales bacterium]|nr:flagellar biosynthesis protein FlhA [Mycobacteriales bacterium]